MTHSRAGRQAVQPHKKGKTQRGTCYTLMLTDGAELFLLFTPPLGALFLRDNIHFSPAVLGDVVQVVTADDDSVRHLAGGDNKAL